MVDDASRARPLRAGAVIAGIIVIQAIALLAYRIVEGRRRPRSEPFRVETVLQTPRAPDVLCERPDGTTWRLGDLDGRPILLHFWATWCPPCRTEMPALLELGRRLEREGGATLVAVSLDANWDVVRTFFDGEVPAAVVRAPGGSHRALEVTHLPDSYLVGRTGQLLLRVRGPRDWSSREAYDAIVSATGPHTAAQEGSPP